MKGFPMGHTYANLVFHVIFSTIERQAEHHKKMTFEEEFVALLKRHGIGFDPRYVWD